MSDLIERLKRQLLNDKLNENRTENQFIHLMVEFACFGFIIVFIFHKHIFSNNIRL